MNRAEELVSNLCKKSFLSLWSYSNPRGKNNKELCDILVVCEPDVIIISVKEVHIPDSGDLDTDWERWRKRAIEKSYKQIYGAERWIETATNVIRSDGKEGVVFPERSRRTVHRIAVAIGGENKMPLMFGDFGRGYVHVFDSISLMILMKELDTISDFVKYLSDKEAFYTSGKEIIFTGGEEDLLAFYIHNGQKFPQEADLTIIDDDLWKGLQERDEYRKKAQADKTSYAWDNLIEIFCKDFEEGRIEFGNTLSEVELVTRTMARENRFARRILAKSLLEFLELSSQKVVKSRITPSFSGIMYVFLACSLDEDFKYRHAELGGRCFVVRGLYPEAKTIIGIAIVRSDTEKGFSLTSFYLYKENWTDEDQRKMLYAQKEFDWFKNPREHKVDEEEYPN